MTTENQLGRLTDVVQSIIDVANQLIERNADLEKRIIALESELKQRPAWERTASRN